MSAASAASATGFIKVGENVFVRVSEIVEVNAKEIRTRSGLTYLHKTPIADLIRTIRACERAERASHF